MKSKMNLLLSVAKNKLITILITQFLVSTSISAVDPTPACIDKQKSVLFILDGSGSVGKSNFKASLDFIQVISDYLEIGEASQDVALEQFGSENQLGKSHNSSWLRYLQGWHGTIEFGICTVFFEKKIIEYRN